MAVNYRSQRYAMAALLVRGWDSPIEGGLFKGKGDQNKGGQRSV